VNVSTGKISTVAGNNISGYSGDGGPATLAKLNGPQRVAVDGQKNIYISDTQNSVIRLVNVSTGNISTVAGNGTKGYSGNGGPATSAMLSIPWGLSVDASGNIYFADLTGVIRTVNASNGLIWTVAGNYTPPLTPAPVPHYSGDGGSATSALLYVPKDVVIGPTGNLFIADSGNNAIRELF